MRQLLCGVHKQAFYIGQLDPGVCSQLLLLLFFIPENLNHGVALLEFMKIKNHRHRVIAFQDVVVWVLLCDNSCICRFPNSYKNIKDNHAALPTHNPNSSFT